MALNERSKYSLVKVSQIIKNVIKLDWYNNVNVLMSGRKFCFNSIMT